jgi:hypothetical protein
VRTTWILILPCGGSNPPAPASYYELDIAYIIVFLGSLFCREFAGVTGLVFKAIRGRDGFTRDFGRGRHDPAARSSLLAAPPAPECRDNIYR